MTHVARSWVLAAVAAAVLAGCRRAPAPPIEPGRGAVTVPPLADAAIRDSVRHVLDRALADSAFPGAIAVVGTRSRVITTYAVGHLDWAPSPAPDEHTLWDMASLSKVMGLTSGMMQLVAQHKVDLDAPVQHYFPDWTGPNKERVTIRHLLTHTSGLPAFKAYDEITHDPDSLAKLMFTTPLDTLPGVRMVYSDIGAYMAGRVLEKVSGETLDAYVHTHVFEPAGMHETMYKPPASLLARIAPTEVDPRRGGLVRGKVHDERAYYLGGVSAHAGIFSSAHDMARFAQMYLNDGVIDGTRILPVAQIQQFTAYVDSTFSNRGIGWQKPDLPGMRFTNPSAAWAGRLMSRQAFGHTGFTGTSIAIDPAHDIFIVLLSNRVNPTRANNKITGVRRQLADAVMSTVLNSTLATPRP
ncbi:MAG: serine hydrolase domain-containing protein [Deltaproteobacteria bacterium]